jgi:PAS domain S-box-containing protein
MKDQLDVQRILGETILSTNSDAIVAADKEGVIFFWNPGAERIFGYSRADAIGQSLDIIIPENLRQRHWHGYHHVMKGGASRYEHGDVLAVPGLHKTGRNISVEFTISPIRNKGGELTGLIAILRDVTKRFEETRDLKRKLRAAALSATSDRNI